MTRRYYRRKKQFALETWQILAVLLGSIFIMLFGGTMAVTIYENRINTFLVIVLAGLLFLGIAAIIRLYLDNNRYKESQAITQSQVDKMSGIDFENYVADLLKARGFKVEVTPPSGDFGVDLIAKKDEEIYAVQVKRYGPRKKVGRSAISDALGGIHHYHATKAMVITNSFYTRNAKFMARTTGTELVDRETLSKWIREFQRLAL